MTRQVSAAEQRLIYDRLVEPADLDPGAVETAVGLALQPGAVDTAMNPGDRPAADVQRAMTPLGRFAHPDEIAGAIAFLAGPDAAFITLDIDGGLSI